MQDILHTVMQRKGCHHVQRTRATSQLDGAAAGPNGSQTVGFRTALERYTTPLTPAEGRLVNTALADPHDSAFLSAAQLAQRSETHESTVIRFAQKLGYAGYPELRNGLRADVRRTDDPKARWMRAAKSHELVRLVQDEIRTLTQLPEFVTQESVDDAAKALLGARRVYIFGQDQWRALVEFMARRLRRIGLDVVAIEHSGRDAAERMVGFGRDDVLLAFGVKGESPLIARLLTYAYKRGGVSILIADPSATVARPAPTHLLAPPRGSDEQGHTLLAPLLLCYALQFALTNLEPDRVAEALDRLEELE